MKYSELFVKQILVATDSGSLKATMYTLVFLFFSLHGFGFQTDSIPGASDDSQEMLQKFFIKLEQANQLHLQDSQLHYSNAIGKWYYNQGDYLEAYQYFQDAHQLDHEKGDLEIADTYHFMGLLNTRWSNYDEALEFCQKALAIFRENEAKEPQANVLKDIGNIYFYYGQPADAMHFYEQAMDLFIALKDETGLSMCYNNMGRVLAEQEQPDKALYYLNLSLDIKQNLGNDHGMANTFINIGDLFHKQGNYKQALDYYEQSLSIWDSLSYDPGISEAHNYLAWTYQQMGSRELAEKHYLKALSLAEKTNQKQIQMLSLARLSDLYFQNKKYRKAYLFLQKATDLEDSLYNEASNKQLNEFKIKYQNLKREKDFAVKEKQIVRQRMLIYFAIAFLLISMVFLFIIYRKNRSIRKKSKKIQKINKELDTRIRNKTKELRVTQYSVDLAVDAIFWMQKSGRFIYANRAASKLLGYDQKEILSISVFDIIPEFTWELWDEYWNQLKQSGSYMIQLEFLTKEGTTIPVETAFNFREFEGQEFNFAFCRNITERKMNEERLKKAKERAEKSDKLKSAFLANMSHEIRTPMNAILGFTELILTSEIRGEQKQEMGRLIKSSTHDLLNLINDIIDFSKIEVNELPIHKRLIYVNKFMADQYNLFQKELSEYAPHSLEFRFEKEADSQAVALYTDETRLRQVMNNLLDNAFKFTEEGEIVMGYRRIVRGGRKLLQFYVRDTGIGISEKHQKFIFDRFSKIEDQKDKIYRGTGLGLAICKKLIEMLDGEIWVESTEAEGSQFSFIVPYQEMKEEREKQELGLGKKQNLTNEWEDKKLLIVEDTESNYLLLENFLMPTGIDFHWAKDGKEAMQKCKSVSNLDAVLMDIQLPGMNGYEVTKLIKAYDANIPVIAQTAYALEGESEISRQRGCDAYLSKPIRYEQLIKTLATFLKKA